MGSPHNVSTEILIIISQTVFYTLLFLMLKSALVDKRGMMSGKEQLKENAFQLVAIFFAIYVFIGLLMIPLDSYYYAKWVVICTYSVITCVLIYEINKVYASSDSSLPIKTPKMPSLPSLPKPSTSSNSGGVTSSTRPIKF